MQNLWTGLIGAFLALLLEMTPCFGQPAQSSGQPTSMEEIQLNLLLHDRPQLQLVVQKGNPIWDWLQSAFRTTEPDNKILWDNNPVPNKVTAGSVSTAYPDSEHKLYIKVAGAVFTKQGRPEIPNSVVSEKQYCIWVLVVKI
jgi:hypothetical protein